MCPWDTDAPAKDIERKQGRIYVPEGNLKFDEIWLFQGHNPGTAHAKHAEFKLDLYLLVPNNIS